MYLILPRQPAWHFQRFWRVGLVVPFKSWPYQRSKPTAVIHKRSPPPAPPPPEALLYGRILLVHALCHGRFCAATSVSTAPLLLPLTTRLDEASSAQSTHRDLLQSRLCDCGAVVPWCCGVTASPPRLSGCLTAAPARTALCPLSPLVSNRHPPLRSHRTGLRWVLFIISPP